jgi:hypothetical protein
MGQLKLANPFYDPTPIQGECGLAEHFCGGAGTEVASSGDMTTAAADVEGLRYIQAKQVEGDTFRLDGFDVVDRDHRPLGQLNGLIIDPASRNVRYLVVDQGKWLTRRRKLVPFGPAHVDRGGAAVQMDALSADDDEAWRSFDADAFPPFSDDDLITAVFSPADYRS